MNNRRFQTASDVQTYLEQRRSRFRAYFNQEVARLEAETRRRLQSEPENEEAICIDAVRRYTKLLGEIHGNSQLLRELAFVIRRQWLGWPIVEVWDGVGIPRDEWELVTQICVAPEGRFWEAREAVSMDQERLDEEERIAYYKQTEPYRTH